MPSCQKTGGGGAPPAGGLQLNNIKQMCFSNVQQTFTLIAEGRVYDTYFTITLIRLRGFMIRVRVGMVVQKSLGTMGTGLRLDRLVVLVPARGEHSTKVTFHRCFFIERGVLKLKL